MNGLLLIYKSIYCTSLINNLYDLAYILFSVVRGQEMEYNAVLLRVISLCSDPAMNQEGITVFINKV